jgi:O-antigen/teichoic acid export membrane protein
VAAVEPDGDVLDTREAGGLIIRGGVFRGAGYVAATGLAILSYALVTRHLGVARFGDYQTLLSIVTVVAAVTEAGMTTLAVREYATLQGEERDRLMRNLLGARLALTGAGVAVAALIAAALGFEAGLVAATAVAGVGVGFNVVQSMVAVPLLANLRLGIATALEVGRQVVLVALLVLVVLAGGGIAPLLAATVPAGAVLLAATALILRGETLFAPAFHPGEWRRLLALTLPVALALTSGTLYIYLVQVLTDTVASEQESGLFAASFRVFLVVGAIPGLVVSTAFPLLARAARDDTERLAYAVDRLFRTTLLAGGLLAVGLAAGAPVAIDVVAGADFEGAVPVLRIQAGALLASFALATLSFTLLTLRRHREILIVNVIALVVSASLGLALAPSEGATGAAWVTVAGETALTIGSWVALRRRNPELTPSLATFLPAIPPLAAGVLVAVVAGLPALPTSVLAMLAFAGVALVTRAVPPELRQLLPGR